MWIKLIGICAAALGLSNDQGPEYRYTQGYSPNTLIQFTVFRKYNGTIPVRGTEKEKEAIEAFNAFEKSMKDIFDNQKEWRSALKYNSEYSQRQLEHQRDNVLNPAVAKSCLKFSRAGLCQSSVKEMDIHPADEEMSGSSADCIMLNFKPKKLKRKLHCRFERRNKPAK